MTTAYVVALGRWDDPHGRPLAIFADQQTANWWAQDYWRAHPEYFGRDQWVVYVEDAAPFIPAGGTPPDPATITS
jgi:hypothetical protein